MKKRLSDKQIISILAKLKPGFLSVSSAVSTPFPMPPLYLAQEAWQHGGARG